MATTICAAASNLPAAPFSDLGFEAASQQAAKANKIVLIDFYTTWCGPCKMLDKTTWTDAAVIQLLEQKTVALRLDAEKETALAKRYRIEAYPSVLLLKPDGTEIDRLVGYKGPQDFMADFNASLNGKDSLSRAEDQLKAAGTKNASARMQFADALAQKGRDAEALKEYLWCFDHGLEADPSFVGVRCSFLLSRIKNLGNHYEPARDALVRRRDECQSKLAGGSDDPRTVQDVIALNNTLSQEEKSLIAFDNLPARSKTRQIVAPLLTGQFLAARRYADVLGGTDGKAAFKTLTDRYDKTMAAMPQANPAMKQMEEGLRQYIVLQGTQYFEALAGLKRDAEARELAGEILKFGPSETTREALAKSAQKAENLELAQSFKP